MYVPPTIALETFNMSKLVIERTGLQAKIMHLHLPSNLILVL